MMRSDVQEFALRRVDGHRCRFDRREQFLVSRNQVLTLDRRRKTIFIRIGLIPTIAPVMRGNRRRPRKPRRRQESPRQFLQSR